MNLYLLRHGIAEPARGTSRLADLRRPLSRDGRKKIEEVAAALLELKLGLAAIYHSPLVRAQETAAIVAAQLGLAEQTSELPLLAPGRPLGEIAAYLKALPLEQEDVLLVGHEPQLGRLAAFLVTERAEPPFALRKGGLIRLSIPTQGDLIGRSRLEWMLPPKLLRRLG